MRGVVLVTSICEHLTAQDNSHPRRRSRIVNLVGAADVRGREEDQRQPPSLSASSVVAQVIGEKSHAGDAWLHGKQPLHGDIGVGVEDRARIFARDKVDIAHDGCWRTRARCNDFNAVANGVVAVHEWWIHNCECADREHKSCRGRVDIRGSKSA